MSNERSFLSTVGSIRTATEKATTVAINTLTNGDESFGKKLRQVASNLFGSEVSDNNLVTAKFVNTSGRVDWRVKLSIPNNESWTGPDRILAPIKRAGAFIFPYTPTISLTHSAQYNSLDPVHSNYPFLAYQNSKVEQITITGDFYCEDSVDAEYWCSAIHYLRTVTKMAFGEGSNVGSPPPVVRLNGYGSYVLENIPVVIKSFTVDLPKDVDYISTLLGGTTDTNAAVEAGLIGYAPVKSSITVVVQPTYSRDQVRKFNLKDFASGSYLVRQNNNGFI